MGVAKSRVAKTAAMYKEHYSKLIKMGGGGSKRQIAKVGNTFYDSHVGTVAVNVL